MVQQKRLLQLMLQNERSHVLTLLVAGVLESMRHIIASGSDTLTQSGLLATLAMRINPRGKAPRRDQLIGIKSAVTQVDFE